MSNWDNQQGFSASNGRSSRSRSRSQEAPQEKNRRKRGRPKAITPKEKEIQSSRRQQIQYVDPTSIGIKLSCAFLVFFEKINLRKGFIMKPEDREDLQRQQTKYEHKQLPRIEWTSMAQWNNTQESDKISRAILRKGLTLTAKQIQDLKIMFLEVSPMFGKEATSELYQILLQVLKMCKNSQNDMQNAVQNFFVQGLKDSKNYHFLNFKFSNIARLKLRQNYDDAYRRLGRQLHKCISSFLASNRL